MFEFKLNELYKQRFLVAHDIYTGFIQNFKDANPLHTDEAFARAHGFQGCVMHGNILNGFISYFVGECLPVKNVIIHSQQIQFQNPVYLNDELIFEAVVANIHQSVNAVEFKFKFKNVQPTVVAKGLIQIGFI